MNIDREILLRIYEAAVTARAFDEKVYTLLKRGELSLFWLSARGQEILGAALGTALEPSDYLLSYYRGLPEQLAKGMDLEAAYGEMLGKANGVCKGRAGVIHLMDPDAGMLLNTGILGAQLPIAAGLALSSKQAADGRVTVCTFGDGTATEGAFHEALNLASLWTLPVVFVCENNGYAENSPFAKQSAVDHVADRASGYNMPGVIVDGNDAVATFEAVREAVAHARRGDGPTLVEAKTYRLRGHYNMDTMTYMPPEELAAAIAADPLPRFRSWLIAEALAAEGDLDTIDERARARNEEAYTNAVASDDPVPEDLHRYLFAEVAR